MNAWTAFLAGVSVGVIGVWLGAMIYSYYIYKKNKEWR